MEDKIKTVFIEATRDSEKGLFGGDKVQDKVKGELLSKQIEVACNGLVSNGYMISNIMPINSGGNNYKNGTGYGYGYAYTSGVVIVATKI
ncbi:hypothetical protein [Pseudoalteromonas sp. P1-11]|uniref:hypothetical protein n=1 Tax=Pseudoalteromonas sp. P1-11 TaxID=1715254 RepID=UPI000AFF66C9|nr:hypothetical protein [Pseudoalteromonas sp. P1-11]